MRKLIVHGTMAAMLAVPSQAWAQDVPAPGDSPKAETTSVEASPPAGGDTVETVALPDADEKIDVDAIKLPDLAFKPDPAVAAGYDKYYYFHREGTDFRAALADVRDCDNLARGLASPYGYQEVPYAYAGTMAGAVGGMIGNLMVQAIFGSAAVRAARRVNMRRCMNFKGYQRYGLPKDSWQEFNFEEGFGAIAEPKRQAYLKQQAKVASGPKPQTEVLGR